MHGKVECHKLADGAQPSHGSTDRDARKASLCDGRVNDARGPELLQQTACDLIDKCGKGWIRRNRVKDFIKSTNTQFIVREGKTGYVVSVCVRVRVCVCVCVCVCIQLSLFFIRQFSPRLGFTQQTLYAPWNWPTSSPSKMTLGSFSISFSIAWFSASRTAIWSPRKKK